MKDKRTIIIFILLIILIAMLCYFFISNSSNNTQNYSYTRNQNETSQTATTTTLKSNSEITASTIENVELHATYYLSEVYVEENQYVEAGTNLIKYTNGTYLTAPYSCCITKLNLPGGGEKVLNSHYIQIQSTNILSTQISIDESVINNIKTGMEAKITVSAVEKTYTGNVTHVSSTATNGKFTVTVEFENDNKLKIGMTGTVEIKY